MLRSGSKLPRVGATRKKKKQFKKFKYWVKNFPTLPSDNSNVLLIDTC
jgi:hypothetical protein